MKSWMLGLMVASVIVSGCSKKDDNVVASPTPVATVQPTTGATETPKGTNAGGAAVTATPKATDTAGGATATPEVTSKITKEQLEKISMTSTYDDLVKQTGSKGQLVKNENGKQTYVFSISNQPGYYAEIVYFADGKISEKRVYQK